MVNMKIGIVGGTGDIGEGMACRLSHKYEIILGSRNEEKACKASECTVELLKERGLKACCLGGANQKAVDEADIIVLSLPFKHLESTLECLTGLENKIVITPINPMGKAKDHFYYDRPEEGSAALTVKKLLPESRVVAAFNNIAAHKWKILDEELDYSVAVCSDDEEAKKIVMNLVNDIPKLKAFDAGPLAVSSIVESITPLVLNIAKYSKLKDVGIQFK